MHGMKSFSNYVFLTLDNFLGWIVILWQHFVRSRQKLETEVQQSHVNNTTQQDVEINDSVSISSMPCQIDVEKQALHLNSSGTCASSNSIDGIGGKGYEGVWTIDRY